jgi:hypothetical protein
LSDQAASIGNSVSISAEEMSQSALDMKDVLSDFKMISRPELKAY